MDRGADLVPFVRIVPEDMLEEEQVGLIDRVAVAQEGVRLQEPDGLAVAAVRGDDLLPPELAPDAGERPEHVLWNADQGYCRPQALQLREGPMSRT